MNQENMISGWKQEGKMCALNGGKFTDCPYKPNSDGEYYWIEGYWSVG